MKKKSLFTLGALAGAVGYGLSRMKKHGINNLKKGYFYEEEGYMVGEVGFINPIKAMSIDWRAGDIVIRKGGNLLMIEESSEEPLEEAAQLRYQVMDQLLAIRYCASGYEHWGSLKKTLTITIPETSDFAPDQIDINSTSAQMDLEVPDCNLEINNVSGDVKVRGESLRWLEINTVSGSIRIRTEEAKKIEINTNSGNTYLEVPELRGLTLTLDTKSGVLKSRNPEKIQKQDKRYVYGSGTIPATVDSVSGNVIII